jgi:hypothetical protein
LLHHHFVAIKLILQDVKQRGYRHAYQLLLASGQSWLILLPFVLILKIDYHLIIHFNLRKFYCKHVPRAPIVAVIWSSLPIIGIVRFVADPAAFGMRCDPL